MLGSVQRLFSPAAVHKSFGLTHLKFTVTHLGKGVKFETKGAWSGDNWSSRCCASAEEKSWNRKNCMERKKWWEPRRTRTLRFIVFCCILSFVWILLKKKMYLYFSHWINETDKNWFLGQWLIYFILTIYLGKARWVCYCIRVRAQHTGDMNHSSLFWTRLIFLFIFFFLRGPLSPQSNTFLLKPAPPKQTQPEAEPPCELLLRDQRPLNRWREVIKRQGRY